MKKITLFIAMFSIIIGNSQNLITNGDFSNGMTGWSGNQAAAPNLVTVSGNTYFSHNVVAASNPWDANLSFVLNIPTAGVNYKLTFKAWSTANRVMTAGIGLNQDPWTNVNQNVNLTATQQTFVLNFTSNFASPTSRIIFDMGHATGVVNIDDVILEIVASVPDPAPTTPAPTPPARPAADVISLFSNAYTNTAVTTWGADWGPEASTISDNPISGNATKKINMTAGKTFAGVIIGSYLDLSTFTHFHIDYWIPSPVQAGQVLSFKLSNHAAQAVETSAIQTLPTPQGGQWVSVDVTLSSFTAAAANGILARNSIKEFVLSAARANNGVALPFYFDNLYFHKNTLSSGEFTKNTVSIYPNPVQDILTINAQDTVRNVTVFNINGQQMPVRLNNNTIDVSSFSNGVYMLSVELENGAKEVMKFVK